MINALIVAIYTMAAATVSLALVIGRLADERTAGLFGFVILLLATQIHTAILRRRERRAQTAAIAELKAADAQFVRAIEQAHTKIEYVKQTATTRSNEQSRKIVSELQVLEGLMREFATRIVEKSKDVAPVETIGEGTAEAAVQQRAGNDTAATYLDKMGLDT